MHDRGAERASHLNPARLHLSAPDVVDPDPESAAALCSAACRTVKIVGEQDLEPILWTRFHTARVPERFADRDELVQRRILRRALSGKRAGLSGCDEHHEQQRSDAESQQCSGHIGDTP